MRETLAELNMKITMLLHSDLEFIFIQKETNPYALSLQEQCSLILNLLKSNSYMHLILKHLAFPKYVETLTINTSSTKISDKV